MQYIPPITMLTRWIDANIDGNTGCLVPSYDDVLDVLKCFLTVVPVDEAWYQREYPEIADYLVHQPAETPASHFQKHGYFEGRRPFAPGWRNLVPPVPFATLKTRMRVMPARGHLRIDISRNDFLDLVKSLLIAVPVDENWYSATYLDVAPALAGDEYQSAAAHYTQIGYFEGRFPFEIRVDDNWYIARYDHVRNGLQRGVAESAQDHFIRLGYKEGCRPVPP